MDSVYTVRDQAVRAAVDFIERRPRLRQERMAFIFARNERVGYRVREYPADEAAALIDEIARIEVETGTEPKPTGGRY